ncbi:hypothetical protein GGR56DRAFT_677274 [Xylariaceae sp. FL0804]|nr:hypothetical protein GGR56DRAFT_677274 [Xylariaceae sp. FL0804]
MFYQHLLPPLATFAASAFAATTSETLTQASSATATATSEMSALITPSTFFNPYTFIGKRSRSSSNTTAPEPTSTAGPFETYTVTPEFPDRPPFTITLPAEEPRFTTVVVHRRAAEDRKDPPVTRRPVPVLRGGPNRRPSTGHGHIGIPVSRKPVPAAAATVASAANASASNATVAMVVSAAPSDSPPMAPGPVLEEGITVTTSVKLITIAARGQQHTAVTTTVDESFGLPTMPGPMLEEGVTVTTTDVTLITIAARGQQQHTATEEGSLSVPTSIDPLDVILAAPGPLRLTQTPTWATVFKTVGSATATATETTGSSKTIAA